MGVEVSLELDVNELGCMINEDAAAGVQIIILSFASRGEETPFRRADKMVNRNLLTRMEVVLA
jgi:hypothetical protein